MKVQIGAKAAASFTLVTPIAPSRLEYSRSMTGRGGAVARVDAGTLLKGCCDALGVAAVVLTAVAAHWPWFKATLLPPDGAGDLVVAPQGLAADLYAHRSLWVAVAAAVVVLALLAARYLAGGYLRVPDDGVFLVVAAMVACLIVAADALLKPGP